MLSRIPTPLWLLVLLVPLLAGALAGKPIGDGMYNYMWRDARFCDDCHVHDYANQGWQRSVHVGLTTCHDCHRVPISHYPRNLFDTIVRPPQGMEDIVRPHLPIVICAQCHFTEEESEPLTGPMSDELRAYVVHIDESPLHRKHLDSETRVPEGEKPHEGGGEEGDDSAAEGAHGAPAGHGGHGGHGDAGPAAGAGIITCMDCHGEENNRGHQFEATAENCLRCHEGRRPEGERSAKLSCSECHLQGFLGQRPQGLQAAVEGSDAHEGADEPHAE